MQRLILAVAVLFPTLAPLSGAQVSPGVGAIPGILDAGPVHRAGGRLYVGNNQDETTDLISVIDISVYGAEHVVGTIATPVNPCDIAVLGSRIYVIDQTRSTIWHRALAGGAWASIALPVAITDFAYGKIMEPHPLLPDRVIVLQFWEKRLLLVNVATGIVEATIAALEDLPNEVVFSGDGSKFAVLCRGYSPYSVMVFDSVSLQHLYSIPQPASSLATTPVALAASGDDLYIVRVNSVARHAFATGAPLAAIPFQGLGRNAVHNGQTLLIQNVQNQVLALEGDLSDALAGYTVLAKPQVWWPPLEQMVAMPSADGRVFVANRNDDSVTVIYHHDDCHGYGAGCGGSGGFVPKFGATGCPYAGTDFTIAVAKGLGGAPAAFFAGTATASLPLGHGCSYLVAPVLPPLAVVPLLGSGPGNGVLVLSTPVPPGFAPGMVVTLQAMVADPGSPLGYSASAGLHLTIH